MTVELKPETERLLEEELQRGSFHSVDELITQGVYALRERSGMRDNVEHPAIPRKALYELLTQPPFAGSGLELVRQRDFARPIEL
jgi:Arc/MetJ-type ribon-helix-helix transcriptional regulator